MHVLAQRGLLLNDVRRVCIFTLPFPRKWLESPTRRLPVDFCEGHVVRSANRRKNGLFEGQIAAISFISYFVRSVQVEWAFQRCTLAYIVPPVRNYSAHTLTAERLDCQRLALWIPPCNGDRIIPSIFSHYFSSRRKKAHRTPLE